MRIIKCKQSLTVTLSEGRILQCSNCTDELFEKVKDLYEKDDEFGIIHLLIPETNDENGIPKVRLIKFWKDEEQSSIIEKKEKSVYWKSVSLLSMPMSFAEEVMKAEREKDSVKLNAYKNFWTLLSLNPDANVRENLFKFLEKWGMVITKSGLFVGYRNADIYLSGETPETTVYTDHHSGTTRIKIGKMVTLDRSKCDCNSSISCSKGLHIAGANWLEQNYYGTTGLVCLVNPIDVVAVPWASSDNYGKIRTCAYLPIAIAQYNDNGHIIPFRVDSGFEEPFVPTVLYDGIMATEEDATYKIPLCKDKESVEYKSVSESILNIARKYIKNK